MADSKSSTLQPDPWYRLRRLTTARIALGRAGGSLPTHEWLSFNLAHAAARDAVHTRFFAEQLATQLEPLVGQCLIVQTQVNDRAGYLRRPDLGRMLAAHEEGRLQQHTAAHGNPDVAIVISDGLSATAAHAQTIPLLEQLKPLLDVVGLHCYPIVIAAFGRVALQDAVGHALGARAALILLGERPGLGSPDSLGAYLVYEPRPGKTDADRNCISNIRPAGLSHHAAAQTIAYLLTQALQRQLSGVTLKDDRASKTITE